MLGSRPLSRTTAFAPRRDLKREKPFHQERPALFVASPKHNPKLPILLISYPSRFPLPWHALDGLRARAATGLGCVQAGAQKLGVIEASYASAIIGVQRQRRIT